MCQCCKFYDNKMKNETGTAIDYCHKRKCGILDPKSTCEDWEMNKSEIPNVTWHEKTESRKRKKKHGHASKNKWSIGARSSGDWYREISW